MTNPAEGRLTCTRRSRQAPCAWTRRQQEKPGREMRMMSRLISMLAVAALSAIATQPAAAAPVLGDAAMAADAGWMGVLQQGKGQGGGGEKARGGGGQGGGGQDARGGRAQGGGGQKARGGSAQGGGRQE